MWIQFFAENVNFTEQLREWAESRLWIAIRPCEEQVRWAIGQLRRQIRGGGICCHMQATLAGGKTITARHFADDPYEAACGAADILRRRLVRCARLLRQRDEGGEELPEQTDADETLVATA